MGSAKMETRTGLTRESQLRVVVCLVLVLVGGLASVSAQIAPTFFGMQMGKGTVMGQPWPVDKLCKNPFRGCDGFGAMRLWDSGTAWALINYAPGQYDWSMLDEWLKAAEKNKVDVVYCFGRVPQWASSKPNDAKCASGGGPGQCDSPNDLKPDGTGTDQHWKDFVTAIATRAAGRIHYWEMWNEGGNPLRWAGTTGQLIRIVKDARTIILSIDPTAVILSPSGGIRSQIELGWWKAFLAAGGGNYVDDIAIHSYLQRAGQQPVPEDLLVYMPQFVAKYLKPYGQDKKPIIDTEASWGFASCCRFEDPNLQAGFVVRYFVLHWLAHVERYYWYEWNGLAGTLWKPSPNFTGPGTLLKPGQAYQQTYNWLVGDTLDQSCAPQGKVWACNLTGPNGYQGQIVWDASKTCTPCTHSQYAFDPIYIQYVDVFGKVTSTSGLTTVPIGYQPILLQNMTPSGKP